MVTRQDGSTVRIEGDLGFSSGQYVSSVHGAEARILQVLGEPLSYEDLICYGAFAFRIGVHEAMCPSAGHPCCGFECIQNSHRSLPWRTRIFESCPWDKPRDDREAFESEACSAIKDSIDRGVPVHYGSEEDGLIIGYADAGRRWLCTHPYHKNGKETFWHDEATGFAGGDWPWGIVVWTEPKTADERVPERELTVAALRQAVEMWNTEKREAYFCGEAAYEHWIDWLRGVDSGVVENPKAGMQGNGWCYDVLAHSRWIAGRWLKNAAKQFKGAGDDELLIAADHFSKVAETATEGLNCTWDLALPPSRYEDWTAEMRGDQIARLRTARRHDREAVSAIQQALEDLV